MILYEQLGRRSALRRTPLQTSVAVTELRAAFCIIALGHFLGGEGGELSQEPEVGCPWMHRGLGVTQVSVLASVASGRV